MTAEIKHVTTEEIAKIRTTSTAKKELDSLLRAALSEQTIAFGALAQISSPVESLNQSPSSVRDDAIKELLLSQATLMVLERLQDTVDRKNTKPMDKEAVGWAIKRLETSRYTQNSALIEALSIEPREYALSDELKNRLMDEMKLEAMKAKASEATLMVS